MLRRAPLLVALLALPHAALAQTTIELQGTVATTSGMDPGSGVELGDSWQLRFVFDETIPPLTDGFFFNALDEVSFHFPEAELAVSATGNPTDSIGLSNDLGSDRIFTDIVSVTVTGGSGQVGGKDVVLLTFALTEGLFGAIPRPDRERPGAARLLRPRVAGQHHLGGEHRLLRRERCGLRWGGPTPLPTRSNGLGIGHAACARDPSTGGSPEVLISSACGEGVA